MFSYESNASKLALASLSAWCVQNQIQLIDCQQETAHLRSLGASPIPRAQFLMNLQTSLNQTNIEKPWTFDKDILNHWL